MTENTVLDNNVSSIIKKKNTPLLRFKRENGEKYPQWEDKLLENIVVFFDGKRKPLEKGERKKGIYPYYGASGIIDYVDNYIFDEELILLSEDGANIIDRNYRVSFLATGKYWVNNHAHVLKGKSGYNNYFICESLERLNYEKYNSGTAQPKLNQEVCKKIKLKIPSSEEQEKIAAFLTRIDNLISTQESNISILETYNRGLISKIFKQEIRFKNDNGNEFPDWKKVKLFDLVEHYGGTALEPLVIENGSCKFISIGNYSPNGKYIDNGQRINPVGKAKDKQLKKDDLVMVLNDKTKNGTIIGSTILIDDDNYIYNQRSERLICKKNVLPYFLWSYINSPLIKNKILQLVQGGTQIYVNFSSVYNMDMHLPIMEEQNKIANFLKQLDKILEQEKVYLEQLKTIKKGLLQQMFV